MNKLTSKQWEALAETLSKAMDEISVEDDAYHHLRQAQSFARYMTLVVSIDHSQAQTIKRQKLKQQ